MHWLKYLVDYGIIGLLICMSVVSVGIFIERLLFLRRFRIDECGKDRRTLEVDLTRGLSIVATIGSNAPYIGLLGTVLGIMFTFYAIGMEGYVDATRVMVGLALALKATAVGLVVAIPSIVFYNSLLRKVRVILAQWDAMHGRE